MDKETENRLARFVNDKGMSNAVELFLLNAFTSPVQSQSSVEEKAAEWLSIQKLKRALKELRNYQSSDESEVSAGTQIGL